MEATAENIAGNYLDLGGTHRARPLLETLEIVKNIAKDIGVTRLANITGLDSIGIPVVIAIRPNAKLLSVSQGKGLNLPQAKVSALMETIEIWHAENIPLPKLRGSYTQLSQTYPMIDPITIAHSFFDLNILRNLPLYWCKGVNLIDNQSLYIPYESISLDSTQLSSATLLFDPSSNGLASGNTTAEAICHALCELIERDAEFKFNQLTEEKQQTQLLNLTSIDSVLIQSLLKKLQDTYVSVQIWDMMSDIGLPAFCCTIFDQDISRKTQIFSGQGCHLNKEVALCRAITEAIQVRLTFISGSRDDVFPAYYEKEMIANLSLLNNGTQDYTKISHIKYSFNFEENIKIISQQLHRCGYEKQCLIQHTSDNSLISVVQVIVPKLRRKEG